MAVFLQFSWEATRGMMAIRITFCLLLACSLVFGGTTTLDFGECFEKIPRSDKTTRLTDIKPPERSGTQEQVNAPPADPLTKLSEEDYLNVMKRLIAETFSEPISLGPTLVDRRLPDNRIRLLKKGGETYVFEVMGQFKSIVVKVPLNAKNRKGVEERLRYTHALYREIEQADPDGAKALAPVERWVTLHPVYEDNDVPVRVLVTPTALRSLDDDVNAGRFGPSRPKTEMLTLWRQMASGVKALHDHGKVHRDIKPSNFLIYLDENGRETAKLGDLGTAVGDSETVASRVVTREYAPIDWAQRNPDKARDLYALSMSFKELLIGRGLDTLNPDDPANHLRIESNLKGAAEYAGAELSRLPDSVRNVDPILERIAFREFETIDDLIAEIDRHLGTTSTDSP